MNKRTFLTLSACVGIFLMFPARAEKNMPIATASLRDVQELIVIADWIACYEDNKGIPGDDITAVFYRNEQLRTQPHAYLEYENQAYLRVKYNAMPDQGCFIQATTATITAVNTLSVDGSNKENKKTATEPGNKPANKNSPPANDPVIDEGDAVLQETAEVESNNAKSFTISCTTSGSSAVRRLETSFADASSMLPCKVIYYREDGKTQVIADAKYTAGYCAEKREAFLKKLKAWGWQCE